MRPSPPQAGLPPPGASPPAAAAHGTSTAGASTIGASTIGASGLPSGAEQQLLDIARRGSRQPPLLALVLHLSRLRPPAPRPHHRRIARAMLHAVVQRHGGQVLGMSNGDLVLLCPPPPQAETGTTQVEPESPPRNRTVLDATSPYELPAFLERLLRIDTPDPERLVSLWPLPRLSERLLAYATARANETASPAADAERPARAAAAEIRRPAPERGAPDRGTPDRVSGERVATDRAAQTTMLDALAVAADASEISGVLRRQTAVMLSTSAAERGRLQPLFREISFSISALEARVGVGVPAQTDPYLFAHLAERLDQRMLETLAAARGSGGPLDGAAHSDVGQGGAALRPPLHVNLALTSIASPGFARFAARAAQQDAAGRGGIEVSLMEACADPTAFAAARARVQAAGLQFVLDRVSHLALSLAEIWPLQPDLVKLEWSPAMGRLDASENERLEAALGRVGTGRVLLLRADTEAALRWGMAHGIRRFQGRHVDAMLAASRLAACSHAADCTLRQCTERAEAAGEAGRRLCRNLRLLDRAVPGGLAEGAEPPARAREIA